MTEVWKHGWEIQVGKENISGGGGRVGGGGDYCVPKEE